MSTSIRYLRIYLHTPDRQRSHIGHLSVYGDLMRVSFNETYMHNPDRLTLSQAYLGETDMQTMAILRAEKDVRVARNDGKLPVYFQNLLPEGNNRERLAKERQCGTDDEFELLAAAGHDLMGAIEVEPVPPNEQIPDSVRLWHTTLGKDVVEPGFVEYPVEDASAIPGIVVKFSAVRDCTRYVVKRHGVAGSYILKLPTAPHPDLVENEATGYALLRSLKIDCAEAQIISIESAVLPELITFPHLLAVKRFDRGEDGLRIHMEEFAQILQYAPKNKYGRDLVKDYSAILRILENLSSQPEKDTVEFVKRFVAFILMGNTDAHLKNWAVVYPDGIHFRLSPAYDPVSVSSFFNSVPKTHYALNREIDRKMTAFSWDDMDRLLSEAKVTRKARLMKIARDTVKKAKEVWPPILIKSPQSVSACITARLHGGVVISK